MAGICFLIQKPSLICTTEAAMLDLALISFDLSIQSITRSSCSSSPAHAHLLFVKEGLWSLMKHQQISVLSFSPNVHLGIYRLDNIKPQSSFVKRMLFCSLATPSSLQVLDYSAGSKCTISPQDGTFCRWRKIELLPVKQSAGAIGSKLQGPDLLNRAR